MNSYQQFSEFYDQLIGQDYEAWADYIEALFDRYQKKPKLVLDLGCGTGSLAVALAKRGYDMLGIDRSADMLSVAMQKGEGLDIRWLQQDICAFELYGTVDAVICTLDVLNYVTDESKLKQVFALVRNYLNPDGLFLFDINTEYKLKHVLGNNIFLHDTDELFYAWDNCFHPQTGISEQQLTFFVKDKAVYRRFDERHVQRAYSISDIQQFLKQQGLACLDVFDCLTLAPPQENSEKVLFAAKCFC